MTFERKVIRGAILLAGVLAIAVATIALREQGGRTPQAWMAVAAALAVIASLVSGWSSQRIIELQENALEPAVRVAFDLRSRYQLAQLTVANRGASPAYDVRVEWKEPVKTVDGSTVDVRPLYRSPDVLPASLFSVVVE